MVQPKTIPFTSDAGSPRPEGAWTATLTARSMLESSASGPCQRANGEDQPRRTGMQASRKYISSLQSAHVQQRGLVGGPGQRTGVKDGDIRADLQPGPQLALDGARHLLIPPRGEPGGGLHIDGNRRVVAHLICAILPDAPIWLDRAREPPDYDVSLR